MNKLFEKKFQLQKNNTNIKTELIAGFATFITMAYVLAIIPNILSKAGYSKGSTFTTVICLIIISTLAMALYTNRAFALAPGLGSASIFAGMIAHDGVPQEIGAGIIIISGILFVLVTFLGLRKAIVKVIPKSLKYAISGGIGLYIALIGVKTSKLVVASTARNSLVLGDLTSVSVILTVVGFFIILILRERKVPGFLVIAIAITTIIGIPLGLTTTPDHLISMPNGLGENFLKVNILGAFNFKYFPYLLALFIPDFFSTLGTVLGVGAKAGYLDENGDLPGIDDCFKVDALATTLGGMFGVPCVTTYLESSVGIESGGRTGLTTLFTSFFFLLAIFFSPLALMIPTYATAPALIYIGISMLTSMEHIDYSDFTEYFPAFLCVVFTIFASNIAVGICLAIIAYVLLKLVTGKFKELNITLYIVAFFCVLYFASII